MYIGPVVFQKLTNEELFNQVVNLFKVIRLSPDSCEEDDQLEADAYLKYFCENKVSVSLGKNETINVHIWNNLSHNIRILARCLFSRQRLLKLLKECLVRLQLEAILYARLYAACICKNNYFQYKIRKHFARHHQQTLRSRSTRTWEETGKASSDHASIRG